MMKKTLISFILFLIPVYAFSPNDLTEFIQKGDNYFSQFDNKSALEKYREAYRLSPDNYNVLFRLARTYNDLGEEYYEYRMKDSSEAMIKKALVISEKMKLEFPDSAATYAYLAMSYGNQAMYEGGKERIKLARKIEENAKKSLGLDPDQYLPYVILGIYYRQIADLSWFERMFANTFFGDVPEGSFEQSIQMFKKALDIKPNTIVASFQLSLTYKAMGEKEKERDVLRKLIKYPKKNFRDKFAVRKAERRLKDLE